MPRLLSIGLSALGWLAASLALPAPAEEPETGTETAAPALPGGLQPDLRGELAGLRHEIEQLCDKVAGQRAYVSIFGPLKSGKSTLMNAIAASYVSEVSSLPAYPCMVFVSHGDKPSHVVTEYGGATETFTDSDALQQRIEKSHQELADRKSTRLNSSH